MDYTSIRLHFPFNNEIELVMTALGTIQLYDFSAGTAAFCNRGSSRQPVGYTRLSVCFRPKAKGVEFIVLPNQSANSDVDIAKYLFLHGVQLN